MNQKYNSALTAIISVVATLCFVMIIVVVVILIKFLPGGFSDSAVSSNTSTSQNPSSVQQSTTGTQQGSSTQQQTPTTMYVANVKNSIYLRSTAAEISGNIITTIPVGTAVLWLDNVDKVFSKVEYNGTTGYVKRDYLSATKPQPNIQTSNTTISKYVYVANVKNSIYLRSSAAETSGNIITTIPLGTQVGYIERTNSTFSKISYNGTIGYAKTKYLSDYYSTGYTYLTVYNVKNSIYLRSTPREVSNNIICTIPVGTSVRYMGESSNGFHKISYNGYVGYSKAIYLR